MGEKEVHETIMPINVKRRYKNLGEKKYGTETDYKRIVRCA